MDKNKKIDILTIMVGIVIVLLVLVLIFLVVEPFNKRTSINNDNNQMENNLTGSSDNNQNPNHDNSNSQVVDNPNNYESSYENLEPVSFLEKLNKEKNENSLKEGFIRVVDFLFYGKTLNGYTFSELTNKAKIKIIELSLSVDKKIDEYFPGYKEKLATNTGKIYNNVKKGLIELYLNTTTEICEKDKDLCLTAKENFQKMKETFNITWDFLKDLAKDGYEKIKEWYEIFREN